MPKMHASAGQVERRKADAYTYKSGALRAATVASVFETLEITSFRKQEETK